jgi:5-formyltetrahydrofolate cyclo-ligase
MRARRRALDSRSRALAAEAMTAKFIALSCYSSARHVAAYLPIDGEMDTQPLLRQAHNDDKRIYLPVLPATGSKQLLFHAWTPDIRVRANRLQILEPALSDASGIEPQALDLVLTPLVAFDARGNRLGMGAGFYDRTFAFLKAGGGKPLLLGLAYEFQRLDRLQKASWDVPLSGVVTERCVYLFAGREMRST